MRPDREKVIDAIRNCIDKPKCRDCPWEDCERFDCKRVNVPVSLMLDILQLLKDPDIIRCKDCRLNEDNECMIKPGYFPVKDEWFCADGKPRSTDEYVYPAIDMEQ